MKPPRHQRPLTLYETLEQIRQLQDALEGLIGLAGELAKSQARPGIVRIVLERLREAKLWTHELAPPP